MKKFTILFLALPMIFSVQSVQGTWKLAQQAGALAVGLTKVMEAGGPIRQ